MNTTSDSRRYNYASASIDITPQHPTPLAGYPHRKAQWQSISSSLEANALLLGDGIVQVLLITADILYFSERQVEAVRKRASSFGIRPAQILLTASHTHFAPATDVQRTNLGALDPRYLHYLDDRLCQLVDIVFSKAAMLVTVWKGRVQTDLNVSRRYRWWWPILTRAGISLGPNIVIAPEPSGPRDQYLDMLVLREDSGKPVALIWKFACHPVCFPKIYDVSSEFPGWVRDRLRTRLRENVPVLYWQGFAGDIRPRITGHYSWSARVRSIRLGPTFGRASLAEWQQWSDTLTIQLTTLMESPHLRQVSGSLRVASASIPQEKLISSLQSEPARRRSLDITALSIGDSLRVFFFGAEVCSPYLEAIGASSDCVGVGYTGAVFGYLPSEDQVKEGGYEAGGFFKLFGLAGKFRDGFEVSLSRAIDGLRGADSTGG